MNDHTKDRHAHEAQVYQLMPRGNDLHRAFPANDRRPSKPPRMSRVLSAIVVAIWLGSIGVVVCAAVAIAGFA